MIEATIENIKSNLSVFNIDEEDIERIIKEFDENQNATFYATEDLMTNEGEWNVITDASFDAVIADLFNIVMNNSELVVKCIIMKDPASGLIYRVPVKGLNACVADMRFGIRQL